MSQVCSALAMWAGDSHYLCIWLHLVKALLLLIHSIVPQGEMLWAAARNKALLLQAKCGQEDPGMVPLCSDTWATSAKWCADVCIFKTFAWLFLHLLLFSFCVTIWPLINPFLKCTLPHLWAALLFENTHKYIQINSSFTDLYNPGLHDTCWAACLTLKVTLYDK